MQLKDLVFGQNIQADERMPLPNSDAYAIICGPWHLEQYVKTCGPETEVEIVNGKFLIPSFDVARQRYSDMKKADCAKWGCE